jgi:hypothetical protein
MAWSGSAQNVKKEDNIKFEMKKLNITMTPQVLHIALCIAKHIRENYEDNSFVSVRTSESIIFASSVYTWSQSTSWTRELQ